MSIMDSVINKPIDLLQRAKELGQSAIAITEHGSCVSLWDGLKASKKTGVKLIAGCEMYFVDDVANQTDSRLRHIILIAKNQIGYKNLLTLNKKGYDNYIVAFKKAVSRIDWKLLEEHKEGLICTTACGNGIISQLIMADKLDAAREQTLKLKEIFGDDLALELQPHHLQRRANAYSGPVDQRKINLALKKLGEELNIRCIVASDTHYLAKEHHKANEVLLAIGCGQPVNSGQRLTYDKPDMYLKSGDEVLQYFERHRPMWGDQFIDSLFANTIYLADKCEAPDWIDPKYTNPTGKELPQFPVKDQPDYQEFLKWSKAKNTGLDEDVMYLRYCCERELDRRFKSGELTSGTFEDYQARVLEELDVLEYHGFSSYMLIVADYLDWARNNGIAVSPGRGSCGGCLVAYLIGIHKADPLKYKLIFARFHNKEKSDFPDVDSDVAPSGREKVQEYICRKYGDEFVAHVSNINTITPKVYARDISRTFEFGDEGRSGAAKIGDAIADSIPAEMKTATQALEDAPLFAEYAKQYPQLKEYAELVGGKARAWSTHAAGIVVNKRKLTGLIPLRRDIYGQLCTEYEKEKANENGLIKNDLLGLETLDIISDTYRLIKESGKELPPEPFDYNAYDEPAYQLISEGNTFCVFQLGSTATHLCKAIKPKCIEDISLINALVRPAAKTIANDLISVREGKTPMHLLHPLLERAFAVTYGFGLYEESLIFLVNDVSGWDLHEAEKTRKLTKEKGKNPEKIKKWREEFISGAIKNKGVEEETAIKIWEIIDKFQGYGFNKSHSILYSMLSYKTAVLKSAYPLEFLVSNLMSEVRSNAKQAKENIIRIKDEIRALGVKIVPPDVNTSELAYKIVDDKTLMTGLDSLKYMGADAIPELIGKRPFHSFSDLISRVDASKVRAPSIQAMAASGSLDSFGLDRKMMFLYASDYRNKLRAHMNKMRRAWDKKNQLAPPDSETAKWIMSFEYPWPSGLKPWSARELYALEEFYMGEGISGTIKERYEGFFDEYSINFNKLKELMPYEKQSEDEREDRRANTHNIQMQHLRGLKGIITTLFSFRVKKEDSKIFGQEMARIVVQDAFGNDMDVIAFPDAWECAQHRIEKELARGKHKVEPGIAIFFSGSFQWENAHTNSFILGDILDYRPIPALPTDLKSRKVKMPRGSKLSKKDIDELEKEDVVEQLEEEMIDEGLSPIGDEDEFDDEADQ
jgi:DNA polymerase III subunit alpha